MVVRLLLVYFIQHTSLILGYLKLQERCASRIYKTRRRKESAFEKWRAVVSIVYICMYVDSLM